VPAVSRVVKQPFGLELAEVRLDGNAAERLAVHEGELEDRALEVIHQDERVLRIDEGALGRRAEEIVGVRDHELVQRRAGGHEERRRLPAPPPRPPGLLPE